MQDMRSKMRHPYLHVAIRARNSDGPPALLRFGALLLPLLVAATNAPLTAGSALSGVATLGRLTCVYLFVFVGAVDS